MKRISYLYFQIYRASVQVVGNMLEVDTKLKFIANNASLTQSYCIFGIGIGKSEQQLSVNFQDGTEFGVLNIHYSEALVSLINNKSLQFDVIASITAIREVISRATKANDAVVRVNINVYGPSEEAKPVGLHLTSKKVYLQRPDNLRPDVLYENPHVLKFPDIFLPVAEYQVEVASNRVAAANDTEQFRETISNVYASLTRSMKLNIVEGDSRLKTQLLR